MSARVFVPMEIRSLAIVEVCEALDITFPLHLWYIDLQHNGPHAAEMMLHGDDLTIDFKSENGGTSGRHARFFFTESRFAGGEPKLGLHIEGWHACGQYAVENGYRLVNTTFDVVLRPERLLECNATGEYEGRISMVSELGAQPPPPKRQRRFL